MDKNLKHNYPLYDIEPFEDFKEMISQRVLAHPDKVAFRFTEDKVDKAVTYKEHQENINALGTAIIHAGFEHDHIAMVGENCYEWILAQITVLGSENAFVPVDKELPLNDLLNVINHSDASLVFCTGSFAKCLFDNRARIPNVRKFVCFRAKEDLPLGFVSADQFMKEGKRLLDEGDSCYTLIRPNDNGLGEIVYTSGTTGAPKGVMLSKHNLRSSIYYGMMTMTVFDRGLSVLPYNHTYESTCDILVSQHKGATLCINENLKTVASNFVKYKPEYVMLVPLFVENFYKKIWKGIEKQGKDKKVKRAMALSNALRKLGIDLRKTIFKEIRDIFGGELVMLVCGGAPIRPKLAEFFDAIGICLNNGYGITECSPLLSCNRQFYNDFRSVGVPLSCLEVKIEDPNEDGEGEIVVKGDVVMMGYYKEPEKTAEVLTEDGWFSTGDYGKMVKDQLFITGRKKNLIVLTNGKNVYPEEIEEYIQNIQEIAEVVVYAIKDENGFESSLCAEVYPDQVYIQSTFVDDAKKYIEKRIDEETASLPGYKHISQVKFRDVEFPKTTSHKIKRQGLGQ